jgi:hypothetical protein
LAIELVSAIIHARQLSFKGYFDAHQQASNWAILLKRDNRIYGKNLVTAWEVSYQQIQQQNPLATDMLTTCGFFNWHKIPLAIFKREHDGK